MAEKPKWLKRIQENSWEPELLISGGAFFTLYTLSDNFIYWFRDIRILLGLDIPGAQIVIFFITVALEGITFLFLFHLIIRAYWTGLIGISYVFPNGIKLSRDQPLHPKFQYAIHDGQNLTQYIEKIERAASLVFGISIRFLMSALGVAFLFSVIAICLISFPVWLNIGLLGLLLVLLPLYVFDILSDMKIRKSPTFAPYYYPIYRFLDLVTLTFIFRPVTQVLITNLTPRKIIPVALMIIVPSIISAYNTLNNAQLIKPFYAGQLYDKITDANGKYLPYFYLNHWKQGDFKPPFQLGRDVVTEYTTQMVFIEYLPHYDNELHFLVKTSENQRVEDSFRSSFKIIIDSKEYSTNQLVFGKNPKTERLGLIGYLSLGELTSGQHFVKIQAFQHDKLSGDGKWNSELISIPFWKE